MCYIFIYIYTYIYIFIDLFNSTATMPKLCVGFNCWRYLWGLVWLPLRSGQELYKKVDTMDWKAGHGESEDYLQYHIIPVLHEMDERVQAGDTSSCDWGWGSLGEIWGLSSEPPPFGCGQRGWKGIWIWVTMGDGVKPACFFNLFCVGCL